MYILPLGTDGFFPSFGRQTMCFAIPHGETLILLDAGTGLYRLGEKEGHKLLKGVKRVHLYLTHYHLDHTFGFYAAFKLFKGKKVTVFGKEEKPVFSEIVPVYFPIDYQKEHQNFLWKKIEEGKHNIDDYTVEVRKQAHGGWGSLAFRFSFPKQVHPPMVARSASEGTPRTVGRNQSHSSPEVKGLRKTLAYVTDSEPSEAGIEFVKEVDLLLHEHWLAGGNSERGTSSEVCGCTPRTVGRSEGHLKLESHYELGHVTTLGAATIAKEAKVGKLALIHHYPFADNRQLEKQLKLAQSIFSQTILAWDLQRINFWL